MMLKNIVKGVFESDKGEWAMKNSDYEKLKRDFEKNLKDEAAKKVDSNLSGEFGEFVEDDPYNQENDVPESTDYDSEVDDMENLCYFIRKLFKNNSIDVDVEYVRGKITVFIFLQNREKISTLMKSFDVVHKMCDDILPEYESEVELFKNKRSEPVLQFTFTDEEYREEQTKKSKLKGNKSWKKDSAPF